MVLGKPLDLDYFASLKLQRRPNQSIGAAVVSLSHAVVDLPVVFERALVDFFQGLDERHRLLGGVPAIDKHPIEGDRFACDQGNRHFPEVDPFDLAIAIGVEESVIYDPILTAFWIDIQAVDHPDSLDRTVCIAAVLLAHHFDVVRAGRGSCRARSHRTPCSPWARKRCRL